MNARVRHCLTSCDPNPQTCASYNVVRNPDERTQVTVTHIVNTEQYSEGAQYFACTYAPGVASGYQSWCDRTIHRSRRDAKGVKIATAKDSFFDDALDYYADDEYTDDGYDEDGGYADEFDLEQDIEYLDEEIAELEEELRSLEHLK